MSIVRIRIAVAGAGLIGLRHIAEIRKSRSAALASIVDVCHPAAEVAHWAGVVLHASLADLFAADIPDRVIIVAPNQLEVDQGLQCLEARVPALIERRVAHALAEGIRLCEAAKRAGARIRSRCRSSTSPR